MAYEVAQLRLEGIQVKRITGIQFQQSVGEHGQLFLKAELEEKEGERLLYETSKTHPITLLCKDQKKRLFTGIMTHLELSSQGKGVQIEVRAKSYSYLMDIQKKSRSFQDTTMTYQELVLKIVSEYERGDCLLAFSDRPLGSIAVQYEETDWMFLKRMLSQIHVPLACCMEKKGIGLYGGVPSFQKEARFPLIQEVSREEKEYAYWKEKKEKVTEKDFLVYRGNTWDFPPLYTRFSHKGMEFVVREVTGFLSGDLLSLELVLQRKGGILEKPHYPSQLVGVALEGQILEVRGTKVRIHLSVDGEKEGGDLYWFPYSTLSASSDGSGWYCMPEPKDTVRVYFPSKQEKDVIAMSSVPTYEPLKQGKPIQQGKTVQQGETIQQGEPDRMQNPSTKYWSNAQGQEVKMEEEGICLCCQGEQAKVLIGRDGTVTLSAADSIQLSAKETLEITASDVLQLQSSFESSYSCEKGGSLSLRANGNLYLKGKELNIN